MDQWFYLSVIYVHGNHYILTIGIDGIVDISFSTTMKKIMKISSLSKCTSLAKQLYVIYHQNIPWILIYLWDWSMARAVLPLPHQISRIISPNQELPPPTGLPLFATMMLCVITLHCITNDGMPGVNHLAFFFFFSIPWSCFQLW